MDGSRLVFTSIDDLFQLMRTDGQATYIGEPVTTTEHMLQCAVLADRQGAKPALIAAALLHDIGHFAAEDPTLDLEEGRDDRHEHHGADGLSGLFGRAVTEPIRLHVDAKRYRAKVEPGYLQTLSPASRRSLELQGGLMSAAETEAFVHDPHFEDALAVRRWDEGGKIVGKDLPDLETFRSLLKDLARQPD